MLILADVIEARRSVDLLINRTLRVDYPVGAEIRWRVEGLDEIQTGTVVLHSADSDTLMVGDRSTRVWTAAHQIVPEKETET